jgi:steroid 5-alpha reductase family enzyme
MGLVVLLAGLALALAAAMALAWVIARLPGRSGWTDVSWSYAVGIAGVVAALAPVGGGVDARRWLVAAMIGLWSLRLGTHILGRTLKGGDDPRYVDLRRQWGKDFDRRLFWFLQIQAAAGFVLIWSIVVAARNPAPFPAWSDWAAVAILLVAIGGETIADRQLRAFAARTTDRNAVAEIGLWGWSRHPNYFFDWLGWFGYALLAIGPDAGFAWGWLALSGPALIYWLLVHASGIPPTEAHMLRSRGERFRDYQRRVNAFFPWPPRPRKR